MRAIRDTMVCAPPFIISEAEIDERGAKARDAIDRTAKDYGKMRGREAARSLSASSVTVSTRRVRDS